MSTFSNALPDDTDDRAIARMINAADVLRPANKRRDATARSAARSDLHSAVLTADDLGFSWQRIGETLGITRGNAYQRNPPHPVGDYGDPNRSRHAPDIDGPTATAKGPGPTVVRCSRRPRTIPTDLLVY